MSILGKIKAGLVDVKNFFVGVAKELPKLIQVAEDVKHDVPTIVEDLTLLASDVEAIVVQGGPDGVAFLSASKVLWPAILAAAAAGGTNIALDLSLIPEVQALVADGKTFENEIPLFEKLYGDYEQVAATIKDGVAKLQADLA